MTKLMNSLEVQSIPSVTGVQLAGEPDQLPNIIPSLNLEQILVPTDFSENSKKALLYAVRIAQRNNSSLLLFHAFQAPEFVPEVQKDFSCNFSDGLSKLFEAARQRSEQRLVGLSREVQRSNIKVKTLQRLGKSYVEIVKVAEDENVDLIVMATHGYTGLKHFLLGSTTERVVKIAPCPVLVVRQRERDFIS
jgi:universal stress protein A